MPPATTQATHFARSHKSIYASSARGHVRAFTRHDVRVANSLSCRKTISINKALSQLLETDSLIPFCHLQWLFQFTLRCAPRTLPKGGSGAGRGQRAPARSATARGLNFLVERSTMPFCLLAVRPGLVCAWCVRWCVRARAPSTSIQRTAPFMTWFGKVKLFPHWRTPNVRARKVESTTPLLEACPLLLLSHSKGDRHISEEQNSHATIVCRRRRQVFALAVPGLCRSLGNRMRL